MEDLKNVVEIKNKFVCAQVFDRVERYTRVVFELFKVETDFKAGRVFIVRGEAFKKTLAIYDIMTEDTGVNIELRLKSGNKKRFNPVLTVEDGSGKSFDIMTLCPYWLTAEKIAKKLSAEVPFNHWKEGSFIFGWSGSVCKLSSVLDYVKNFLRADSDGSFINFKPRLLHIEKIINMTDEEFTALNIHDYTGGFKGGSFSEDIGEESIYNLSWPRKHSFIQRVCLIRTPSRWIAIDPQGYDYTRYVYFPLSWCDMFADVVLCAKEEIKEAAKLKKGEEAKQQQRQKRAYTLHTKKAVKMMDTLGVQPLRKGQRITENRLTENLRAFLSACFPETTFDIRNTYTAFERDIVWSGSPDSLDVSEAVAVMQGDAWECRSAEDGQTYTNMMDNDFTRKYGKLGICRFFDEV